MSIQNNLIDIQNHITKIADQFRIEHHQISLLAVSKKQPEDRIEEALNAGHRLFGENRVQEAQERWAVRRSDYPDLNLHLIGPLQTNKVKDAVALFDVIHTLDREKLAKALCKEMKKQNKILPCFIQVNTGEEDQKSGIFPKDLQDFHEFCVKECGLNIQGLMCIPPIDEPAGLHFALLKKLAEEEDLSDLSMGMSADYQKAIPLSPQQGKLYIRIGTGVFGSRSQ